MFHYLRQNKHIIAASLTLFVISLSTLMFFVTANHDIQPKDYHTTVLENGKELSPHTQEEKYRSFVHNDQDSLIVLNPEAKIEFVSWDFEVLFGHELKDIQNQAFSTLLDAKDQSTFLKNFQKVLQLQQTVNVIGPYRLADDHGRYHFHVGTAVPIIEGGKVIKIILITHDINESIDKKDSSENDGKSEESTPKGNFPGEKIRNQSDGNDTRLMAEKIVK